jgi:hypothetical protein
VYLSLYISELMIRSLYEACAQQDKVGISFRYIMLVRMLKMLEDQGLNTITTSTLARGTGAAAKTKILLTSLVFPHSALNCDVHKLARNIRSNQYISGNCNTFTGAFLMILSDVFDISSKSFSVVSLRQSFEDLIVLMLRENLVDVAQVDSYFSAMVKMVSTPSYPCRCLCLCLCLLCLCYAIILPPYLISPSLSSVIHISIHNPHLHN